MSISIGAHYIESKGFAENVAAQFDIGLGLVICGFGLQHFHLVGAGLPLRL